MARTMIEKVLTSHCREGEARAGEIVVATPDLVLLNDVSGPVTIEQFAEMGATRVRRPSDVVLVADHFAPATDLKSAAAIQLLRRFGEEQGIEHYYDTGTGGIEHAVIAERGFVQPGGLIFGADSHTCTAGALNASGIGFGSSDLAAALALGELWVRVPEAIRIELSGTLARYVSGKDVILHVLRAIGADGALGAALEFGGPGLANLGVDARMAVANMAVEAGAETCLIDADEKTEEYLAARNASRGRSVVADPDADYRARHQIDLSRMEPLVALPPSPANVVPVSEVGPIPVQQVYIGNCSNGTLSDLRQTAEVLRGRKVARGVRLIVVPATQRIYRAALKEGLLDIIIEAGGAIAPPTCGACFGGHMGILAEGENAVATTNRNFRGRMGHTESNVYLANAWVAAAASVAGEIVDPIHLLGSAA